MAVIVILLLLALIFGIGAVAKGVLWLLLLAVLLAVITVAFGMRTVRRARN
jgi:hypothetical protein